MVNRRLIGCLVVLCAALFLYTPVFAMSGQELAEMVYDRDDGDDAYFKTEMVLFDRHGNARRRLMENYVIEETGLVKTFVEFLEPPDIRGTRFLSWENPGQDDTQYLYLPELGRARRIVSSQKRLQFVNTDFTYEDMQRRRPDQDEHTITGEDEYLGRPVYVMESVPLPGTSQYGKRLSWIDQEGILPVAVDFFDRRGDRVKEFRVLELENVDGIWTAMHVKMRDLKNGHRTEMRIVEVVYNQGVPAQVFELRNLER